MGFNPLDRVKTVDVTLGKTKLKGEVCAIQPLLDYEHPWEVGVVLIKKADGLIIMVDEAVLRAALDYPKFTT